MRRAKCVSVGAGQTLVFLLGFALVGAGLRRVAPFPEIPQVSEKLAALGARAGEYDALFLGSSKINSGIIPAVFDAALAARGRPLHSFNLGIDGMGFPENAYLGAEALRRAGGSIRWVFIELSGIRLTIDTQNLQAKRLLYWHDLPRTWLVCRGLLALPGEKSLWQRPETRTLLGEHLRLGAQHWINLARGADWLATRLIPRDAQAGGPPLDLSKAGFLPMQHPMAPELVAKYRETLAHFPAQRVAGDALSEAALRELARRVARAGATAIFILPPNPVPGRSFLTRGEPGTPPVLACDDPQRFPDLYEVAGRADEVHLNPAGAHRFTTTLAGLFADYLEKPTPPAVPAVPGK